MPSMFSLEGKNAAIVGGGSGIGEAVAIACAEQGAYVRCLDVKLDAATETAATAPPKAANGSVLTPNT